MEFSELFPVGEALFKGRGLDSSAVLDVEELQTRCIFRELDKALRSK